MTRENETANDQSTQKVSKERANVNSISSRPFTPISIPLAALLLLLKHFETEFFHMIFVFRKLININMAMFSAGLISQTSIIIIIII